MRWLSLERFGNNKNITSAATAAFPRLDFLSLDGLKMLEEIWDDAPIPSNSFNNLKELRLVGLHGLKRMGKSVLSITKDFFLQLETIHIQDCYEMEHLLVLVPNEEEEQDKGNHITTVLIFPKLKKLVLFGLPKLRSMICSKGRGIDSIQFPLLTEMLIRDCTNLRCFVSRDDDKEEDDDSLHLFCPPNVSFGNLKEVRLMGNMKSKNVWCDKVPIGFFRGLVELRIYSYNKMRRLFSSSKILENLVNLQRLNIHYCEEMVKVIECDEHTSSRFPSLQHITLSHLPKLESFCEWRFSLELPSLKKVRIEYCDEMKSFNAAAGSFVIAPALQAVEINRQDLECVDDLNAALHQHFEKGKEMNK